MGLRDGKIKIYFYLNKGAEGEDYRVRGGVAGATNLFLFLLSELMHMIAKRSCVLTCQDAEQLEIKLK